MLVLTRKKNQSIMIGKDIEITIADIEGGNIRIGIKAPKDVPIFRKEVYDAIVAENAEASQLNIEDLDQLPALF